MVGEVGGPTGGERGCKAFGGDALGSVRTLGVSCQRIRRVEENVVNPIVTRSAGPNEDELSGRGGEVKLAECSIARHFRRILSRHCIELLCGLLNQGFVFAVVIDGLRNDGGCPVGELNDSGYIEQVLIETGVEKDAVLAYRPAYGAAELLLLCFGVV